MMMWTGARMRIVVVGEKGTGKSSLIMAATRNRHSSLIMAAATDTIHPNIPSLLPYTDLPSEFFPDRIPATVIDTSSRMEDNEKVLEEVKQAHVIVLTFAFDRPETLDRLSDYWLPLFRQLEVRVPIVVAGYTVDGKGVCDDHISIEFEKMMSPMMQQYPEVEASIQWSSQRPNQAKQVLYSAHKAYTHPVGTLFNRETKSLKPRCIAALKMIFILSDRENDGILSDDELRKLQEKCFNSYLSTPLDIKQLKKDMQVKFPQGVTEEGLTLDGFLFLNKRFIEEGRIETLWTILYKFGYNKDLRLVQTSFSFWKQTPDQSFELTNVAIKYLREVYEDWDWDEDTDRNLKPHDIEALFQCAPESPWNEAPYKDASEETKDGGLSLEAFISLWSLMTLIDPARSAEYLKYLLFPYDLSLAIHKIWNRGPERNVVQCFVFGPKNAGKSALLNQFIGRPYDDDNNKSTDERYAVNMVKQSEGFANKIKTLVLKEMRIQEDGFTLSMEASAACDVAIFIYDSSDESSWNRAIDLLAEVATSAKDAGYMFPCLMVAAKTDLDSFPMAIQESTKVTQEIGLDAPVPISSKLGDFDDLFRKILTAAEHPYWNIPEIESKKKKSCEEIKKNQTVVSSKFNAWILYLIVALIACLASFLLYTTKKQS